MMAIASHLSGLCVLFEDCDLSEDFIFSKSRKLIVDVQIAMLFYRSGFRNFLMMMLSNLRVV